MKEKIELLKTYLEISQLTVQEKLNKIIQTLRRTEDPSKARMLSERILTGDFEDLQEKSVDDLVSAFAREDIKKVNSKIEYEDKEFNNKDENLAYRLRTLESQMESMEYNYKKKIKELEESNNKLASRLNLTKNSEVIEVSDDDINELYIRNLENNEISYRTAFIKDDIIPKSYYKIKK